MATYPTNNSTTTSGAHNGRNTMPARNATITAKPQMSMGLTVQVLGSLA